MCEDGPEPKADDLPVVAWEVPEERKRVPRDIQEITGAVSPVVRVDRGTWIKQRGKHRLTLDYFERFSEVIEHWEYYRRQPAEESRPNDGPRWQFLQFIIDDLDDDPWPLLSIFELLEDSTLRLVTSHRRKPGWGRTWPMKEDVFRRRGK